jgi:hypothetical protein
MALALGGLGGGFALVDHQRREGHTHDGEGIRADEQPQQQEERAEEFTQRGSQRAVAPVA